ncbi:MAG: hypothetical protein F4X97_07630 [Boseongicola sp. SB0662_bin_57]|nr:hypothetical protein [Boseongicola sp. SB0662_bin_57]
MAQMSWMSRIAGFSLTRMLTWFDSAGAPVLSQLRLAIGCDPAAEQSADEDHLSKILPHVKAELGKIRDPPKVRRQFGIPAFTVPRKKDFT